MSLALLYFFISCTGVLAASTIHSEPILYRVGETELVGYLAYDASSSDPRPGVLVVHEWWGLNDYAKYRANALAKAGYIAMALDMYGEGKKTEHPSEAGAWATRVGQNKELALERFVRAMKILNDHPLSSPDQVAAIGYCFGGGVVLSMAQRDVGLKGVVSFHGSLNIEEVNTTPSSKILVCHGSEDSMVTVEQINLFQKHLTTISADWQFIQYGGAKHSFTNPKAHQHGIPALAYSASADSRSWQAMLTFLSELFQ